MTLKLKSPAKINLFLRVLHKRADGYHEISSLFQAIDLCDTLSVSLSNEDRFTTDSTSIPKDDSNLILKALKLFREKSGRSFPVSIHLEKKIPTEAGLGGGSSNAATTLYALNQLIGAPFSEPELARWGSSLGSDVPFFFSTGTALCTGRGENVRSLPLPPDHTFQVYKPPYGLSTPQVYKAFSLEKAVTRDPEELLKSFYSGNPIYLNDLEIAAFQVKPELKQFKDDLERNSQIKLLMSGSGSSFFSVSKNGHSGLTRSAGSWY